MLSEFIYPKEKIGLTHRRSATRLIIRFFDEMGVVRTESVDNNKKISYAESLEQKAKELMDKKEYDKAVEMYERALDIYRELGWVGQVRIMRKQIIKVESLKNFFQKQKIEEDAERKKRLYMEAEAEKLASAAKKFVFDGKYEEAIKNYRKCAEIYEELGYSFQVKRMNWEIAKIEGMMVRESETPESTVDESFSVRKEEKIHESGGNLPEEKSYTPSSGTVGYDVGKILEKEKEERRKRLEEEKRRRDLERKMWIIGGATTVSGNENVQTDNKVMNKKMEERKKADEAFSVLDNAKRALDEGDFDTAAELYAKAGDIFSEIGWKEQAAKVYDEVELVKRKKAEMLERIRKAEELRKKRQIEMERAVKAEKEKEDDAAARERDPQKVKKINMAELNIEKGRKDREKGNSERAIKRFEYALELLREAEAEPTIIARYEKELEEIKKEAGII